MDVEFLGAIGLGATLFSAIVSSIWFYRKRLLASKDMRIVAIEFSSPEGVDKETVKKIIIYFENLDPATPVVDINRESQVGSSHWIR